MPDEAAAAACGRDGGAPRGVFFTLSCEPRAAPEDGLTELAPANGDGRPKPSPVAYVIAWLDAVAASSSDWQKKEAAARQLTLF